MSIFDRRAFTAKQKQALTAFYAISTNSNILDLFPFVLTRVNTLSTPDNIDTFVMSTCANPLDKITYTSSDDIVDLTTRDGGFF